MNISILERQHASGLAALSPKRTTVTLAARDLARPKLWLPTSAMAHGGHFRQCCGFR